MSLLQSFQSYPAFFVTVVTVLSLAIGSFLNVVIHRLPKMLERQWRDELAELNGQEAAAAPRYNLVLPRSQCPACGHPIGALENVPLVSYLVLGGKCSACKAAISPRYPLVEALTGALSGYIAWRYGFTWHTLAALVFVWAMIALAFIDLDTFYLPDDITLPLVWAGSAREHGRRIRRSAIRGNRRGRRVSRAVGWCSGATSSPPARTAWVTATSSCLAAIGAWLGWKMLPVVILLSSLVGAMVGIALIVFARHGRNVPIPFGPYLVLGGLIALFWGDQLLAYYLQTL